MFLVISVCDDAANEPCPVWSGLPVPAHSNTPDPKTANGQGVEITLAFGNVYRMLRQRIELLLALTLDSLDRLILQGMGSSNARFHDAIGPDGLIVLIMEKRPCFRHSRLSQ